MAISTMKRYQRDLGVDCTPESCQGWGERGVCVFSERWHILHAGVQKLRADQAEMCRELEPGKNRIAVFFFFFF